MPLTATLVDGLDGYAIGPKVRELRSRKKMRLVELGAHTGLSAALLSKIERGKMYPTLPTLLRIALVFSVGLDYFFTDEPRAVSVVRKSERRRFPDRPGARKIAYHFESLDFSAQERTMSAYLAEFEAAPVDDVKLHTHPGEEFLFVLDGKLGLYVQDGETLLDAEDAVHFDSTLPHGYRRVGRRRCRALVVVTEWGRQPRSA